jgi:ComF family protein
MNVYISHLLDLFFPRLCVACSGSLAAQEQHLCIVCLSEIPQTYSHLETDVLIDRKFWGKINVKKTYAFLKFTKKGKVQNILHALKYKNKPELAEYIGKLYGNDLKAVNFNEKIDIIIGIPLHPAKKKMRGYNQADEFAKGLSVALGVDYNENLLTRESFTESQTKTKSRFGRFKNMEGVFGLPRPELIKNKRIALVDDVLTTGATLEMAGELLLSKGCSELYIITMASAI